MKSSNMARQLEELEAVIHSLQLSSEPTTRQVVAPESAETIEPPARVRRTARVRTIETRDQGLRLFRVF